MIYIMQKCKWKEKVSRRQSVSQLGDPSARVFEVFLIVLDGVQEETLWGGESRARDHTHKREQKAGQAAVERTTGQQ